LFGFIYPFFLVYDYAAILKTSLGGWLINCGANLRAYRMEIRSMYDLLLACFPLKHVDRPAANGESDVILSDNDFAGSGFGPVVYYTTCSSWNHYDSRNGLAHSPLPPLVHLEITGQ
jgi:hypothetical protein